MKFILSFFVCALFAFSSLNAQTTKADKMSGSNQTAKADKMSATNPNIMGRITITDSNGEVVFEDNDPEATCQGWTDYLNRLDASSAAYLRNNFRCNQGRISFSADKCIGQYFAANPNMTWAQFQAFAAEYAANPQVTSRKYCTISQDIQTRDK